MNNKIIMSLALLACAPAAHAGGQYTGIFKPVYYGSLYVDGSTVQSVGRPACATRTYLRLQEEETAVGFKNKYAMILAAWLSARSLLLVGTGSCTSEGDEIIYVVAAAD